MGTPTKAANSVTAKAEAKTPFHLRLKTREAFVAYVFLAPFLILFSVFFVRATITSIRLSFFDWRLLRPGMTFIGLGNYIELFRDSIWWDAVQNTMFFAIMTVIGATVFGMMAALAVTRRIRGGEFFRVLFYVPQLMSVGAIGLVWNWLLSTQFGTINYFLSFIGIQPINWLGDPNIVIQSLSMVTVWWTFGFPMLIYIAGLQNIPDQLYEAAKIDGANSWQTFVFITLPLLSPAILFVMVTGFIGHFQVFGQPQIITAGGGPGRASWTVIIYLFQNAWVAFRMGYGTAIAMVIAGIMAIVTMVQFKLLNRRVEY